MAGCCDFFIGQGRGHIFSANAFVKKQSPRILHKTREFTLSWVRLVLCCAMLLWMRIKSSTWTWALFLYLPVVLGNSECVIGRSDPAVLPDSGRGKHSWRKEGYYFQSHLPFVSNKKKFGPQHIFRKNCRHHHEQHQHIWGVQWTPALGQCSWNVSPVGPARIDLDCPCDLREGCLWQGWYKAPSLCHRLSRPCGCSCLWVHHVPLSSCDSCGAQGVVPHGDFQRHNPVCSVSPTFLASCHSVEVSCQLNI